MVEWNLCWSWNVRDDRKVPSKTATVDDDVVDAEDLDLDLDFEFDLWFSELLVKETWIQLVVVAAVVAVVEALSSLQLEK